MLPLVFLPGTPVALAGRGPALAKRLGVLEAAGLSELRVYCDAPDAALAARLGGRLRRRLPRARDLRAARLLFVAGLPEEPSDALATAARALTVPVNVEDVPHLCDFHVPAAVRRGDLLLTASTAGAAPALAAAVRGWLEAAFGPEWADRTAEIAALRAGLRASGAAPAEVIRAVRAHMDATGWLATVPPGGAHGATHGDAGRRSPPRAAAGQPAAAGRHPAWDGALEPHPGAGGARADRP